MPAIAIQRTGLVTSVGLSAPASCAAFRAKLTNPSPTQFVDAAGTFIMAHQVALDQPWRGIAKLSRMTAMAIGEALDGIPKSGWAQLPLLLCVAETDRPGRLPNLNDQLFSAVEAELGAHFAPSSAIVAQGRVGVAVALSQARALMARNKVQRVLVAAVDSLLLRATLRHYEQHDRILTETNSNGFIPGEAAGALLLGEPTGATGELLCTGLGFAREVAHIDSETPLRADGLTQAIQTAMTDASLQMHDMDFRITDIAGEHYYFKEAALAFSRSMRVLKDEFDMWHPAECTGEVGAAVGATILSAAKVACDKRYARGRNILVHMANDTGQRAALTLQHRGFT